MGQVHGRDTSALPIYKSGRVPGATTDISHILLKCNFVIKGRFGAKSATSPFSNYRLMLFFEGET